MNGPQRRSLPCCAACSLEDLCLTGETLCAMALCQDIVRHILAASLQRELKGTLVRRRGKGTAKWPADAAANGIGALSFIATGALRALGICAPGGPWSRPASQAAGVFTPAGWSPAAGPR